jgi:hypothetical protein
MAQFVSAHSHASLLALLFWTEIISGEANQNIYVCSAFGVHWGSLFRIDVSPSYFLPLVVARQEKNHGSGWEKSVIFHGLYSRY